LPDPVKAYLGKQESTGMRWSAAQIIRGEPEEPEGGFFSKYIKEEEASI